MARSRWRVDAKNRIKADQCVRHTTYVALPPDLARRRQKWPEARAPKRQEMEGSGSTFTDRSVNVPFEPCRRCGRMKRIDSWCECVSPEERKRIERGLGVDVVLSGGSLVTTEYRGSFSWSCGTATRVYAEPETPDQKAALATWFLHIPSVYLWSHYILSVIHLRPIEGVRPAHKQYPEAEYELTVIALDPREKPRADDVKTWHHLTPINVTEQFHGVDDEGAIRIAELAARAVVDRYLVVEPEGIWNAREQWHHVIQETVEHETHGGYPARAE